MIFWNLCNVRVRESVSRESRVSVTQKIKINNRVNFNLKIWWMSRNDNKDKISVWKKSEFLVTNWGLSTWSHAYTCTITRRTTVLVPHAALNTSWSTQYYLKSALKLTKISELKFSFIPPSLRQLNSFQTHLLSEENTK